MNYENLGWAFGLTLFAGLSTGVGSALAFFARRTDTRLLAASLGFSAGVMIFVSLVEIFTKARDSLTQALGHPEGSWAATIAFFVGIAFIAAIDKLVPDPENPHEMNKLKKLDSIRSSGNSSRLLRMGLFTALAIGIHNFPEGLATFTAALSDPMMGLPIAFAIAIHNIPEGMAVSVPIYYATGSRKKAFVYSFVSGLAEPAGALLGFGLLLAFFSEAIMGYMFAAVAGIMVFISLDQLLPTAEEFGEHHLAIYGLVAGMALMAFSLLLFL